MEKDKTQMYSDNNKTSVYGDHEKRTKESAHQIQAGDIVILNNKEYKVIELVSESTGEAVIYKAEDSQKKIIALKLYYEFHDPEQEPNTEALERIQKINDPDILNLIDYGTGSNKFKEKYCFEISDFAYGHDLLHIEDLTKKYTPNFLEKDLIPQIFKGIIKLHQNKIYHCDLKPQNVFYLDSEQKEIVVGDYGSAKTFDYDSEKSSRKTTTVKGTDFYLPPEQARGFISEKNDYYSFGMILMHVFYPGKILTDDGKNLSHQKLKQIIERQFEAKPIIDYDTKFKRINQLIEGLTLADFNLRWGEKEVTAWLKGESINVNYRKLSVKEATSEYSANALIFGNYTINTVYDLRDYILNEEIWYEDLIEDEANRKDFTQWFLELYKGDRSKRSAFNRIVKDYSQDGLEFISDAIIRFFIPEHPVIFRLKSFDFAGSDDLMKTTGDAFSYLISELWDVSSEKEIKLYIFRYEFALRYSKSNKEAERALKLLYNALAVNKNTELDSEDFKVYAYRSTSKKSKSLIKQFLFNYLSPSSVNIELISLDNSGNLKYKIVKEYKDYFPETSSFNPEIKVDFGGLDSKKTGRNFKPEDDVIEKICKNNNISLKDLSESNTKKFRINFKKEYKRLSAVKKKADAKIKKTQRRERRTDLNKKFRRLFIFLKIIAFILLALIIYISIRYYRYSKNYNNIQDINLALSQIQMVNVEGSTFIMGNNEGKSDEQPEHSVTLNDFQISKYEITNEQFCHFLNIYGSKHVKEGKYKGHLMFHSTFLDEYDYGIRKTILGWRPKIGYEDHPAVKVSWYGANEYCKWAGGRLPTEAEWEYAARGGSKSKGYHYAGADYLNNIAWYKTNSGDKTHPVGRKDPNELGIYDMCGNVCEWCEDWYDSEFYKKDPIINPVNLIESGIKVKRGGGYYTPGIITMLTYRNNVPIHLSYDNSGFRLCMGVDTNSEEVNLSTKPQKNKRNAKNKSVTNKTSGELSEESKTNNTKKQNVQMVFVDGGTFKMGNAEGRNYENHEHNVSLKNYYISKYEITNEQFCEFLNEYGSETVKSGTYKGKKMFSVITLVNREEGNQKVEWTVKKRNRRLAVTGVYWHGAKEYCNWAGGRLPTEAEWEFAAKGGNRSKNFVFAGSDSINEVAWYNYVSDSQAGSGVYTLTSEMLALRKSNPVGKKKPNELGIYDMSGNMAEWCEDTYSADYYRISSKTNPCNISDGRTKCIRGGSVNDGNNTCKTYKRDKAGIDFTELGVGFRMVKDKM